MKRMIAAVVFAVLGTLGAFAQDGVVRSVFYMDYDTNRIDTCFLSMRFVKGIPTGVSVSFNHKDKKNYMLAFISGNPNMYHCYKNVEQRINDFRSLLETIRDKYQEWTKTARENKVVSYSKEIGRYDKVPILSLNAYVDGECYVQKYEPPYIKRCNVFFDVDKRGKSVVYFAWYDINLERAAGYNEGLLFSHPIMERIVKQKIWFQFSSVRDIQSLIDALDIEKMKQILLKKTEKDKKIDVLFK